MNVFVLTGVMVMNTLIGIEIDRYLQVFNEAERCIEVRDELTKKIEKSNKYKSYKIQCEKRTVE